MTKPSRSPLTFAAACVALLLSGQALNAALLNLGSSGSGSIDGAFFSTTDLHPTGTGVFDPFMTIQASPTEQGYNSSVGNFDTKREPVWNHEIQISDLRVTTISGTDYFGFVVDINEPGNSKSPITLDGLRIWTSSTLQNSTSTDSKGVFNGSLGTLVYDMGNNSVRYDDQQHGSGSGDLEIFVPVSLFGDTKSTDYVYMYQMWGNADISEGGFEETALLSGFVPVPELATLFPIIGLMVAVFSTQALRRRQALQLARQRSR
jgi:hypothetical protein